MSLFFLLFCQILTVDATLWQNIKGPNKVEPSKGGPNIRRPRNMQSGNGSDSELGTRIRDSSKGMASIKGPVKRTKRDNGKEGEPVAGPSNLNECRTCRCAPDECVCYLGKQSIIEQINVKN